MSESLTNANAIQKKLPLKSRNSGMWAYYRGGYHHSFFKDMPPKADHVTWFRALGLPDWGPGFDNVMRGRMLWEPEADHWVLSFYGAGFLPNNLYRLVTKSFGVGSDSVIEKRVDQWPGTFDY